MTLPLTQKPVATDAVSHTPGPWVIQDMEIYAATYPDLVPESPYGVKIASLLKPPHGGLLSNAIANSKLISTAPDLLASLEVAINRVKIANNEGDTILSAWLPEAINLVSKAKGES